LAIRVTDLEHPFQLGWAFAFIRRFVAATGSGEQQYQAANDPRHSRPPVTRTARKFGFSERSIAI
jgi:hypothetical protein